MGLDMSRLEYAADAGDAGSWSYSGFMRFRESLAKLIGIELREMDGFDGTTSWDTVDDDIKSFLYHSDCDGYLDACDCEVIAPRLRELGAKLEDEYDKEGALRLADQMDLVVEEGGLIKFG